MAETKDMQGYYNLIGDKRYAQSKYYEYEELYQECTRKINRLKAAKETIAVKKVTFNNIKRNDKRTVEAKYEWAGSTYKKIIVNKGTDLIDENNNYYEDSIDHVLDAINDEITRLQNKRRSFLGSMNGLLSAINNLSNRIENYFNW